MQKRRRDFSLRLSGHFTFTKNLKNLLLTELFGAVLAQSGSFWWRPNLTSLANGNPWMAELYTQGPRLPVRFFLSGGRYEISDSGAHGLFDIRQMREALNVSGYDVKYEEIEGQHDWINWRLTLPDGLIALDPVPAPSRNGAEAHQRNDPKP